MTAISDEDLLTRMESLSVNKGETEPKVMPDGSRLIFTTRRSASEDLDDPQKDDDVDMLHFTYNKKLGAFRYLLARDVVGGTTLFHDSPLAHVSLFSSAKKGSPPHRLLPLNGNNFTMQSLFSASGSLERNTPSMEWALTYAFLTTHSEKEVRNHLNQLPQSGPYSHATELRNVFKNMPKVKEESVKKFRDLVQHYSSAMRWISALSVATKGVFSTDELLLVYGSVVRNSMQMVSPLASNVYGIGLYPSTSYMDHSCVPSAQAVFEEGGIMRIEAFSDLPAGTPITLNRFFSYEPMVRCIQLAPAWMRRAFDSSFGYRCVCEECIATLQWLRESAAAKKKDAKPSSATAPPLESTDEINIILNIVESTWKQNSDTTLKRFGKYAAHILASPLGLSRSPNIVNIVCSVGKERLSSAFGESNDLHALSLARAVVEGLSHEAARIYQELGTRVVNAAVKYEREIGNKLLIAVLRGQHASDELISKRVFDYNSRTSFGAFVATCSFDTIKTINTMSHENRDEFHAVLKKALPANTKNIFKIAWRNAVVGSRRPPLGMVQMGERSEVSAARKMYTEANLSRIVGLVVQIVGLNDEDEEK